MVSFLLLKLSKRSILLFTIRTDTHEVFLILLNEFEPYDYPQSVHTPWIAFDELPPTWSLCPTNEYIAAKEHSGVVRGGDDDQLPSLSCLWNIVTTTNDVGAAINSRCFQ